MARAGLTSDRVVDCATQLANEAGLGALTLSAVASTLGVQTPSLYKHVDGLASLRRLVGLRAKRDLASVLALATVGRSRSDALRALAAAYREWAAANPASAVAVQAAPLPGDEEDVAASTAVTDVVFSALFGYGLSEDALVDATRTLRAGLIGYAALEAGGGFGMARRVDESFAWWLDAFDTALSVKNPGWEET